MLMNDKIIFDRYYCINSAQTKEIMVHYILQPRHIFIHVKLSLLCSFRADFSTACAGVNCNILKCMASLINSC